ncbi:phage major capsid protein [Agrobacterium rhizogenes]|uniref:phage major capsid protein n=1 Tax=Rhizobium rhizogenes TaxID=359 RepID=UPI0022B64843|nr:phage major capsid protein [Rhizobium rhizogenes]MCZ7451312.1 phage major capsid protein [Rhizobium rhizogenes]
MTDNIATKIEQLGSAFNTATTDLSERISGLEKSFARMGDHANDNRAPTESLGDIIANSEELKSVNSSFRGKATIKILGENAAITSGNTTVGTGRSPGTSLVPGHRIPDIVTPYQRQMTVRDLLGQARTTSNAIEWPVETGFTNNAAPVAEGAAKPYSDLTFDLKSAPVVTIAHLFKVSRQIMDDAPALAAYIERRGVYGLQTVEENQLLNGSGTGQNLKGIIPQATAFAPTWTSTSETPIDRVLQAISQAEDAELPVTGVVINKRDWRRILGTKDAGGNYIVGNPQNPNGGPVRIVRPGLWDLDLVPSNVITPGKMLVGAFKEGATVFDRMDVEVLISSENADDFEKNLLTVRIEERLALATFRPEAFIYGNLYAA